MSSAHDLAGGAHTIAADSTETYFTFTDSVGGGVLTLEAGGTLEFDDSVGAGFLATSLAFTLTINGSSTHECYIKSVNTFPDHRWATPNALCTGVATECTFMNYTGTFPVGLVMNNPTYVVNPYAYCTSAELINLTGSTLPAAALAEIIGQASNEINSRLILDGITVGVSSDPILSAICLNKSYAFVMRRMFADGTRAGSVNTDGGGSGPNPMDLANERETQAEKMLVQYIRSHLPSTQRRLWVQKVNEHG